MDLGAVDAACAEYVIIVVGGLEALAAEVVSHSFGGDVEVTRVLHPSPSSQWSRPPPDPPDLVFPGEAGAAKLYFKLPRPTTIDSWAAQHLAIASLPITQAVLTPLAFASGIHLDAETALPQCEAVMQGVSDARWDAAIRTWRYCRASPPPLDGSNGGSSSSGSGSSIEGLSFRASGMRDGKHNFESPQIAQYLGAAVLSRRPSLKVDLFKYDIEIVGILLQGEFPLLAARLQLACSSLAAHTLPLQLTHSAPEVAHGQLAHGQLAQTVHLLE